MRWSLSAICLIYKIKVEIRLQQKRNNNNKRGKRLKVILQTRASTCSFPESLVTQTLKGIKRIMTATPAKMDTPMVLYRKYKETLICSGANHTSFNSIISSNSRCVSTDIKVTISPAVDSLREALPKRRAWGKKGEL